MDSLKNILVVFCLVLFVASFGIKLAAEGASDVAEVHAEKWLNTKNFSLEENKDKIVVLEFWATWCPPCRASIPHLKQLSDKYKDKVVFVSLTSEEANSSIENFCKNNNMTWIIGLNSNSGSDYRVTSIPNAFIINKGKIAWRGHPMDSAFESKLAQLVAENGSENK